MAEKISHESSPVISPATGTAINKGNTSKDLKYFGNDKLAPSESDRANCACVRKTNLISPASQNVSASAPWRKIELFENQNARIGMWI